MKLRKLEVPRKKSKKAVSAMIGYVLLVTFGIILSVIAYNYLKTYVPKDIVDCPDATSIFVKEYNCNGGQLNLTLKNNGKFNYAGIYIHGAEYANQSIATINLVQNLTGSFSENAKVRDDTYISFAASQNFMTPGYEDELYFTTDGNLELIEITPVRYQTEGNTVRFVSCGQSKTKEEIKCT